MMKKIFLTLVPLLLASFVLVACDSNGEQDTQILEEHFFTNQMNVNNRMPVFVTDDSVYIARGLDVIIYDANFVYYSVLAMTDVALTLHVTDESIYFTNYEGELHRHDRETGVTEVIRDGIHRKVIVGNRVFYLSQNMWGSNLYAYDLETGITQVVIRQHVMHFFIDPANNRILFTGFGDVYQADLNGQSIETVGGGQIFAFAYDGNRLYWDVVGDVAGFDFVNNEELFYAQNFSSISAFHRLGDYLVVKSMVGNVYLFNPNDRTTRIVATTTPWGVLSAAVAHNHIIYRCGIFEDNMYVVNLDGIQVSTGMLSNFMTLRLPEVVELQVENAEISDFNLMTENLVFINQNNANGGRSAFITEDYIYVRLNQDFVRYETADLTTYEVILSNVGFANLLYVSGDYIFYTLHQNLYRYNRVTRTRQLLIEYVWTVIISENLVFYQPTDQTRSIYVYDMNTSETRFVAEVDENRTNIRSIFVDRANNRLVFNTSCGCLFTSDLDGGNFDWVLRSRAQSVVYDGERLFWDEQHNYVVAFNFETNEIETVREGVFFAAFGVVGDYLFGGGDGSLTLMHRETGEVRMLLPISFPNIPIGNLLIVRVPDSQNYYIIDLDGNIAIFRAPWQPWNW